MTVFNWFETDTPYGQEQLVSAMRDVIDTAPTFPGWVSSTVHSGLGSLGTANVIQMRSREDMEARYRRETMKNATMPAFYALTTSFKSVKTELAFVQSHPSLNDAVTMSPDRDDYTVIILFATDPEYQKELVDTLGQPDEWLLSVPGYLSHSILRSFDNSHVVLYAQWESKQHYDEFHHLPEDVRPEHVQEQRALVQSLVMSREPNTYRVVHSRSAESA